MKKAIVLFSVVFAVSSLSQAIELCGLLGSHVEAPKCQQHRPCPHFIRLAYDLQLADGHKITLETANREILQDFESDLGANVCVEGEYQDNYFEVTGVTGTPYLSGMQ